uniref:Hyaluronidase n=1 Tax=Branchiostoma floridae TaxID=7739 RepID=C3XPV2_BRAFL|eukprot:XP_002613964.1 hypothetical protein BRAFLDRAFT_67473 [Branchiostoma floridae]
MSIEINLDGYEIVYNPGHEWNGTYMTIFYARDLGLYPSIHEHTGEETNGGLPQKADLQAHLTRATDDISRLIPDADYRGVGVIDWEFWRPLWRRNWGSKKADLQAHLARATDDISRLIPDADYRGVGVIDWEFWRPLWRRNWGSKADLASSIQEPAGQGSAGVVIWGAWEDVNSKENCLILRDYVTTTFGPFAKEMVQQAADCSRTECNNHGRVDLNLGQYDIVVNPGEAFMGPYISLFYERKLGMCPCYHEYHLDQAIHGGLPQTVDLSDHKEKVADDIARIVPDADYQGLGVIDWESWRPLYERNWAKKDIYRKQSEELVQSRHPDLSKKEVKAKAKEEYETAARAMMEETLDLVKSLRPGGFWGFYLFPDSYNSPGSIRSRKGKTYGCPQKVKDQNDRLDWLWEGSTGLYPSVYVTYMFKNMVNTEQFVRGRVSEAFRVMDSRQGQDIPIYPYMWLRYREEIEYITQADLVHSIGEIAGLGSAGVVIWGASFDVNSKAKCLKLEEYVRTVFGPYAKKITATAVECGQRECSGHGRCVTNYETSISHEMMQGAGGLEQAQALQVEDFPDIVQLTPEQLAALDEEEDAPFFQAEDEEEQARPNDDVLEYFQQMELQPGREGVTCRCYPGWAGDTCASPAHEEL